MWMALKKKKTKLSQEKKFFLKTTTLEILPEFPACLPVLWILVSRLYFQLRLENGVWQLLSRFLVC